MDLDDFKQHLLDLHKTLTGENRKTIKKQLKKLLDKNHEEKEKVIIVCESMVAILNGEMAVLQELEKRRKYREHIKKKNKDGYLSKKEAIQYTGFPQSTFERKAKGLGDTSKSKRPRYKIDDLDRLINNILFSSPSVMCLNSFHYFDQNLNGYLNFDSGESFKIIEENEMYVYLYDKRWNYTIRMQRKKFEAQFLTYNI